MLIPSLLPSNDDQLQSFPLSVLVHYFDPTVDAMEAGQYEISLLAAGKKQLHFWNLAHLSSHEDGKRSQLFDLSAFAPELCIEDVSFLDGFDRDGCVVGVAGSGGVVLVVDWRRRELLWKVGEGARGES